MTQIGFNIPPLPIPISEEEKPTLSTSEMLKASTLLHDLRLKAKGLPKEDPERKALEGQIKIIRKYGP
jgi:hypothetical protein